MSEFPKTEILLELNSDDANVYVTEYSFTLYNISTNVMMKAFTEERRGAVKCIKVRNFNNPDAKLETHCSAE